MNESKLLSVPTLSSDAGQIVLLDLVSIAGGDELDIPWRRIRVLLDHKLAEICDPVIAQGSNTSLNLTPAGLKFLDDGCTQLAKSPCSF